MTTNSDWKGGMDTGSWSISWSANITPEPDMVPDTSIFFDGLQEEGLHVPDGPIVIPCTSRLEHYPPASADTPRWRLIDAGKQDTPSAKQQPVGKQPHTRSLPIDSRQQPAKKSISVTILLSGMKVL